MFKTWSLKTKTVSAFALVASALLLVGGMGYVTMTKVATSYRIVPMQDVPNLLELGDMRVQAWHLRVLTNRLRAAAIRNDDAAHIEAEKISKEIADIIAAFEKSQNDYDAIPSRPAELEAFKVCKAGWKATVAKVQKLVELAHDPNTTSEQFDDVFVHQYRDITTAHLESLEKLVHQHADGAKKAIDDAEKTAAFGNTISAVAVFVGFFGSILFGFLFSNSLTKTLADLSDRLKEGAQSVAETSKKIASSSSDLSASTTEQAAALQETVSSVDEVSAMINKNADNAKQSQDVALLSQDSATKGREAVNGLISSIDDISRSNTEIMAQIEDSNRQMAEIVKVIGEIGSKTKVINDIVFQTKLLSFNASVEAARAGEHGKGFAVVAEEVGNLAQMSGNAAKEIGQMLDESSTRVAGIVEETKSKIERLVVVGREKVQDGTTRARGCGDILEEIVGNVSQVNQLMTEIATASREQSQGVQEITKAMAQLDQVTQQNAVASQDSANSSDSLSRQAVELRDIITRLTLTVEGDKGQITSDDYSSSQPARAHAKTLDFKRPASKKQTRHTEQREHKVAVGGDSIPAENDPRFEDV